MYDVESRLDAIQSEAEAEFNELVAEGDEHVTRAEDALKAGNLKEAIESSENALAAYTSARDVGQTTEGEWFATERAALQDRIEAAESLSERSTHEKQLEEAEATIDELSEKVATIEEDRTPSEQLPRVQSAVDEGTDALSALLEDPSTPELDRRITRLHEKVSEFESLADKLATQQTSESPEASANTDTQSGTTVKEHANKRDDTDSSATTNRRDELLDELRRLDQEWSEIDRKLLYSVSEYDPDDYLNEFGNLESALSVAGVTDDDKTDTSKTDQKVDTSIGQTADSADDAPETADASSTSSKKASTNTRETKLLTELKQLDQEWSEIDRKLLYSVSEYHPDEFEEVFGSVEAAITALETRDESEDASSVSGRQSETDPATGSDIQDESEDQTPVNSGDIDADMVDTAPTDGPNSDATSSSSPSQPRGTATADQETEHKPPEKPIATRTFAELSGFRRDLLVVIAGLNTPKGLQVKTELEKYYDETINHGRLYPNLDTLVEKGLIEKTAADNRSNSYKLTDFGEQLLRERLDWEASRTPSAIEPRERPEASDTDSGQTQPIDLDEEDESTESVGDPATAASGPEDETGDEMNEEIMDDIMSEFDGFGSSE